MHTLESKILAHVPRIFFLYLFFPYFTCTVKNMWYHKTWEHGARSRPGGRAAQARALIVFFEVSFLFLNFDVTSRDFFKCSLDRLQYAQTFLG